MQRRRVCVHLVVYIVVGQLQITKFKHRRLQRRVERHRPRVQVKTNKDTR